MKQDVVISIMVKQASQEGEDEVIELLTRGTLEQTPEQDYLLSYEESEMTGLEGTTTIFFIQDKRIVLERRGAISSRMEFELGQRHHSSYNTMYGSMDVEVHTKLFAHSITPKGGEITLDYNIEISKTILGNNFFLIKVTLPEPRSHFGDRIQIPSMELEG